MILCFTRCSLFYMSFNVFLLNVFIACHGSQSFFIYDVDDLDMTCLRSLMIKNLECDTILNSVPKNILVIYNSLPSRTCRLTTQNKKYRPQSLLQLVIRSEDGTIKPVHDRVLKIDKGPLLANFSCQTNRKD